MMRGNHGNLAPQRKVSLEHSSGSYASGMPHGVPMMSMHSNNMHQIHMNEMMMADYQTMMGLAPDPYDVSFMPMHPSEATSMGTNNFMMDQMMDFPNSRFVSPLCPIPRRRPSRDVMLPEVRSQMDDHELLEMQQQMNTPQMFQQRLMIQNNARHTNLNNDAHGSYLSANPSIPPPSTGPNTDTIQSFQQSVKRKERAPSSTSFPTKLYKIMADPQYESYIAWLPHGRAWRVLKPKGLEEDVIPKFFRSDRYASFMRQVRIKC